jgi:hypothetical protein
MRGVNEERRDRLQVVCPGCSSRLVVDAATGEVISHQEHKAPPADGKGLDELLEGLDREKEQAEDLFQKEVAAFKDRDRLLAEKFEEAMKAAEDADDATPPPRPFDFD